MNELFLTLGIESWKPVITALVLPPVPFLLLMLAGARLMFRRRLLAWCLVLLGAVGSYLAATQAVGILLNNWLLRPPRALTANEIADLKRAPRTAIVVLGGGRRLLAPEYGISTLSPRSMERLRFGLWLAKETGLPVAFSGGVGHGAPPGTTEGEIAGRVAEREYGRALRWTETDSRDTRENAQRTVALLAPAGIEQIVLVTEAYHMPRALRNFEQAADGRKLRIVAAPLGVAGTGRLRGVDWLPSLDGYTDTWLTLHEWLGRLAGA